MIDDAPHDWNQDRPAAFFVCVLLIKLMNGKVPTKKVI